MALVAAEGEEEGGQKYRGWPLLTMQLAASRSLPAGGMQGFAASCARSVKDMAGVNGSERSLNEQAIDSASYVMDIEATNQLRWGRCQILIDAAAKPPHARRLVLPEIPRDRRDRIKLSGLRNLMGLDLLARNDKSEFLLAIFDRVAAERVAAETLLAIREFERANGKAPQNLQQLVGGKLSTLPEDPYMGEPLAWDAASRTLSSRGRTQTGEFLSWTLQ
jgi:hypothetical protein